MKILHTTEFYSPSVGGVQEVVKQISERLVKMGHDITVATSKNSGRNSKTINGVKIKEFDISGNQVYGYSGNTQAYQKFLIESGFDIITHFSAQQWATDLGLEVIENIKAKKVIVPTGFSALKNPKFNTYFKSMEKWLKNFDMSIFLSQYYQDMQFAKHCGIKKTIIIPNGASSEEFLGNQSLNIRKLLKIPSNHLLILHVGSHTKIKGHKEAFEIFKQAKIENATFLLIGNCPLKNGCLIECKIREKMFNLHPKRLFDKKHIIVANLKRIETVAAYKESNLFLFPSNIECSPIVLFECLASKIPFLTTDVGNAKEIIEWTNAGILMPTTKDKLGFGKAKINASAKLLEDLYMDKTKLAKMGLAGFNAWKKRFTWEKISQDYEKVYTDLMKNG